MDLQEHYDSLRREFKAICLVETKLHKVGDEINVITFVKPGAWFYVENLRRCSRITYTDFYEFQKSFKIV